jgi:hypothetical protein
MAERLAFPERQKLNHRGPLVHRVDLFRAMAAVPTLSFVIRHYPSAEQIMNADTHVV